MFKFSFQDTKGTDWGCGFVGSIRWLTMKKNSVTGRSRLQPGPADEEKDKIEQSISGITTPAKTLALAATQDGDAVWS
jgi:hypothetical protein